MRYIFFVFCFFSATANLFAQQYSIAGLNLDIKENNEKSIVRNDQYKVEIQSPSKMTVSRRKAVTYLKDPGSSMSPFLYYNDLSDIKDFELNVYNAGGELVGSYTHKDAKDIAHISYSIYEDSRIQYFELGKFSFPITVEHIYEQKYKGIMYFTPWLPQSFDQHVESAKCEITLPEDMELFYRFENADIQPKISHNKKQKVYTWTATNLSPIEEEPYSPHSLNLLPSLQFGTNEFEVENYEGSYANWQQFGMFLQQFYEDVQDLPTSIKSEIATLTERTISNREKISLLYNYLQNNCRYVSVQIGIGGWKTYDAEYVTENKYGDCKALSNYMVCLLKAVDIPAYPVIIERSSSPYRISDSFVFHRFNHSIIYVPSEDMFIECTADSGPEQFIGSSNEGRQALLVNGSESHLIQTPKTDFSSNRKTTTSNIYIKEQGMATVQSHQAHSNHRQEYLRYLFDNMDQNELEKKFRMNYPLNILTLDSLEFNVHDTAPLVELEYSLQTKEIASILGKRLFLNLNPLFHNSISLPNDENRSSPIRIRDSGVDNNYLIYHLPPGYSIESLPKSPIEVKSKWGEYSLSFEYTEDHLLKVTRNFAFYDVEEDAEAYDKIKAFFNEVDHIDKETKVVLIEQ